MSVKHSRPIFCYLTVDHLPTTPIITVSITTSGTNTAGETYSLECSATVVGSTSQPTLTWLHGDVVLSNDTNRTVSASTMRPYAGGIYNSTLTFEPLATSHAGTYKCRTIVAGNVTQTDTKVVSVASK